MRHGDAFAPAAPSDGRRVPRLLALGLLPVLAAAGVAPVAPDLATRATYLVRLAAFVTWPATAFSRPADPLTICIIGDDPFGTAIDAVAKGQKSGAHPIVVERAPDLAPGTSCHIVYARTVEGGPLRIFASVARQPVLTVAEAGEIADGAMVHFVAQAERVRFTVDLEPVAASGLTVSSQLLNLAAAVRRGGE